MARIRTLKPDAFTSDTLSSVSVLARWTFVGLFTYVDDEGRGRWDPRLIKAALFPLDDATTLEMITEAVKELEHIDDAVCVYQAEGRSYLHLPKWSEHQKISHAAKSKIPPCPCHEGPITPTDSGTAPTSSGGLPEPLPNVTESLRPEQGTGNREQGTGNTPPAASNEPAPETKRGATDDHFDAFWAAYPRPQAKGAARKAWTAALKRGADPAALVAAAGRFATLRAKEDPKFTPHPATWLNQERYDDEPANAQAGGPDRVYFTPTDPPDGIAGDPEAYREWYQGEVRKHRAELEQARKGGGAQ